MLQRCGWLGALTLSMGMLCLAPEAAAQSGLLPDERARETGRIEKGANFGPVLESYGSFFTFDDEELVTPDTIYKVVFDTNSTTERGAMNPQITAAARFLNMHVGSGVPKENIHAAVVLYGPATHDALSNDAHQARFGVDNPNIPLIEALAEAGVPVYVCVQSASSIGIRSGEIEAPARMTLSGLTALVKLQADGYQRVY